jgi:addiction module HigA family antidote
LSVSAAATALGVRRATLSDLINGNAALSPEMALRVEKAFGVNMETLLRMQAWHDAAAIRSRASEIDVKPYLPTPATEARKQAAPRFVRLADFVPIKPERPPRRPRRRRRQRSSSRVAPLGEGPAKRAAAKRRA